MVLVEEFIFMEDTPSPPPPTLKKRKKVLELE